MRIKGKKKTSSRGKWFSVSLHYPESLMWKERERNNRYWWSIWNLRVFKYDHPYVKTVIII